MKQRIALDPQLEISTDEFTAAWNSESPVTGATATVTNFRGTSFLSPEMTTAIITTAMSIPAAIIASFVTELLKKKFLDKPKPEIITTTITDATGEPILVITQRKE